MGKYPAWCFFPPQNWDCWFCSCLRKNRDAWFAKLILCISYSYIRQHSTCHLTCCWHRAHALKLSLHQIQPTVKTNLLPNTHHTTVQVVFACNNYVFINCIEMYHVNVTSTHYNIKFIKVNTCWRVILCHLAKKWILKK